MVASNSARRFAAVAALALLAFGRTAHAQSNAAAADVLFNQARELTDKGDYAAACPKLEESERLDPGMGTLYRLGDCYEHVGRTASAWASFHEVMVQAQSAAQTAREVDARQRAAALEPLLARLTIKVPQNVPGVIVERDGVQVGQAQWGLSLPVDPGAHVLVAHAPGKIDWRTTINVAAKDTLVSSVPALADAPKPPPVVAESPSSRRTVGLVVGGVGVAALGVSGIFGLISIGHKSDVNKNCDDVNGCNQTGADASKSAVHTGNISTGFFIGGAVLAAGGITLFLTSPRPKTAGTSFRITAAANGAALEGTW